MWCILQTTIEYAIDSYSYVSLSVLNTAGIEIKNIASGYNSVGHYWLKWDGSEYPPGIYFVKFTSEDYTQTKKLMLIK